MPMNGTDSVNRTKGVKDQRSWGASALIRLSTTLGATASRWPVPMEAQTCPLHEVPPPSHAGGGPFSSYCRFKQWRSAVYNDDRSGHASSQA
jgi:hypothetical protein